MVFTLNAQTTFTESGTAYGLNIAGTKDGGMSFADYDNDGDMDLMMNAGSYSAGRSYLLRNDGGSFTDVTASLAPGLTAINRERQAVWGDLNNDGLLDFMRTTGGSGSQRVQVFIQDPSTGKFGRGTYNSTSPITIGSTSSDDCRIYNGLNCEGAGFFDFEGDGDLDIYFDNHNYGVDIVRNNYINHTTNVVVNPAYGSLFTHATAGTGTQLGLAQSATDGDYASSADVNDDGWVDLLIRKRNENDFFLNGGGSFSSGQNIGQAYNSNKGGVALFDLDNDGDFDALWTDNDSNFILQNNAGTYVKLVGNLSIETRTDIDGVDGADIDNDGDVDLIFSGDTKSYIYINQLNSPTAGPNTGTAFSFTLDATFNTQTGNTGNGEAVVFVDIDDDGDMDFYENTSGTNQLWINNLYTGATADLDKDFIVVNAIAEDATYMQTGAERHALGANIVIKDCDGNVLSGVRNVNGGSGHGNQNPLSVHFGLPYGLNSLYFVEVSFPNYVDGSGTSRAVVTKVVNPAYEGTEVNIRSGQGSPITTCDQYDIDRDSVPNGFDIDDDDDGIMDITEIFNTATTDFSGLDLILFDNDGNGIDPTADGDHDGIANYLDASDTGMTNVGCVDANADGVCDVTPSFFDQDLDNIPNFYDLDSDNDGIPDMVEANGTDNDADGIIDTYGDIDGDGLFDAMDVDDTDGPFGSAPCTNQPHCLWASSTSTLFDLNGDGTNDWDGNTDNDDLMDYRDTDSDNDGISDILEIGGVDSDNNGYVDNFDLANLIFIGSSNIDGDGWDNAYDGDTDQDRVQDNTDQLVDVSIATHLLLDTDRDGIADFRDLDSDYDGIPDLVETGGADVDGDGRVDNFGLSGWDSDEDGWSQYYDGDLNNDGSSTNSTYVLVDSSIFDASVDQDGDGHPNHLDIDSDNDGLLDQYEVQAGTNKTVGTVNTLSGLDADGDGLDNQVDADNTDGPVTNTTANGTPFAETGSANSNGEPGTLGNQDDFDNDGVSNYLDYDSDNDGILDILESVSSATPPFTAGNFPSGFDNPATADNDANIGPSGAGDGLLDVWDNNTAAIANSDGKTAYDDTDDSDGAPDFIDFNSDGDFDAYGYEFYDYIEHFDFDRDAESGDDLERIASMYIPINGAIAASRFNNNLDSDGDDIPNWFDDADADGIPNFLDPGDYYYRDTDQDGLIDLLDVDHNGSTPFAYLSYDIIDGTVLPYPVNLGNAGDPDFRDVFTALYLPVEFVSFDADLKDNFTELTWVTANEDNNKHFEVERSYDNITFDVIGTVLSLEGEGIKTYTMDDRTYQKTATVIYYRVKQVDYDNKYSYTSVDVVRPQSDKTIQLYPNPATNSFRVNGVDVVSLRILSNSGKILREVANENVKSDIQIDDLSSGYYWVEITTKETTTRQSLLIYK